MKIYQVVWRSGDERESQIHQRFFSESSVSWEFYNTMAKKFHQNAPIVCYQDKDYAWIGIYEIESGQDVSLWNAKKLACDEIAVQGEKY